METGEMEGWLTLNKVVNGLLAAAVVLATASLAWGLDVADMATKS